MITYIQLESVLVDIERLQGKTFPHAVMQLKVDLKIKEEIEKRLVEGLKVPVGKYPLLSKLQKEMAEKTGVQIKTTSRRVRGRR